MRVYHAKISPFPAYKFALLNARIRHFTRRHPIQK
jgi:hypothetical protein